MNRVKKLLVVGGLIGVSSCAHMTREFTYPVTRKSDQVDNYHGTPVADPYRWLEDTDSPETAAWVEAENRITFDYLESIPERESIKERITELWDYERFGVPFKRGERYFIYRNDGLQNQSVLYTMDSLDGELVELLDPNNLSDDGTVALSGLSISDDGNLMAYATSTSGSDWKEWRVRDVTTQTDRDDLVRWSKFSGASWRKDGSGFFYSRYDEPQEGEEFEQANYFQKLYFHKLGSPQSEDVLIYDRPDEKEWGFDGTVTDDGRFLIITIWESTSNNSRLYYKSLGDPDAEVVQLIDTFDAEYSFIDNDDSLFWIKTTLDAPKGRIISIDVNQPERENWQELISHAEETIEGIDIVGDRFIVTYLKDARSQVKVFDLNGGFEREVSLPGIGTAEGFSGQREETETFYSFTSFTTPGTIYRYDVTSGEITVFKQPTVDFDPDQYVTKQVFYESKDGTRIPMFITHKRGIVLDGNNPTLLYGYGGFNISLTPGFSVANLVWMEMGGVYAVPNLRGGGEYGEDWHLAGTKQQKQNVFDDFIAAAEWLITNNYTRSEKLAISGGSNGGLLVGACMTQRPELFGATLPAVGVMDMLRFHKFTIGWAWVDDYGSSDNAEEFPALYAYSPLHNLKPGVRYPSTLITTADHDDRVVPGHSFKFAAVLQEMHRGENPVLIRIETKAGHGAGKPTSKRIEEAADKWAFLLRELGMSK